MSTEKSFEERLIEKDERAIAPNIFIGLGGQGCKMVSWLAKKAKQEKSPAEYLSFVAIDTDVNELRKIKAVSNDVVTIQTSSRMTIGEYLEYDSNARENWFPINDIILDKTPSEGAGQVRAISNLVAHNAIREGEFTALNNAIDSLFPLSTDNYEQSVHVTVISTLAGGTGSGLILPVSLYVKNYLETIRQQKSAVIRGFFILPDVMQSVITNEVELDNQYSNAYASIREIDALMRRPYDIELQKRYPNLKVIVPKVGGDGYDEFNSSPFNFCFLFNKINVRSTEIKGKDQLLHHAVECIYDMSVSPICTRVNSQEDNIIREKISSGNKSSYAGAGASKVVYPYDSVVDYVALNWAKNSISKKWLAADNHMEEQKREKSRKQNEGGFVDAVDENSEFVTYIESKIESDNFYRSIVAQTKSKRPNSIELDDKAGMYIDDLKTYIEYSRQRSLAGSKANELRDACILSVKQASAANARVDNSTDKIDEERQKCANSAQAAISEFLTCQQSTILNAKTIVDIVSDSIITADPDKNKDNDVPVLEKYMRLDDEIFMHPNAARYFLAKISLEIKQEIEDLREEFEGGNGVSKNYDDALKEIKRLANMGDEYEHRNEFANLVSGVFTKKVDLEVSERIQHIVSYLNTMLVGVSNDSDGSAELSKASMPLLDKYCMLLININVLKRIYNYIENLSEGLKEFYFKMASDISKIPEKISAIENYYSNAKGIARIYVCSSKKCLQRFSSQCKNTIGTYDLPKEFTRSIFNKAKNWAIKKQDGSLADEYGIDESADQAAKTAGVNAFFGNVFEDIIMGFWRERVEKDCSTVLDMDIVSAIYKEAQFEANCISQKEKNEYLKKIIGDVKNLAAPFIDAPRGVQRREIRASAINPDVMDNLREEDRNFFENECLNPYNPEKSSDVSKYKILFFDALYNIAAKNLAKMVAPRQITATNSINKSDKCGKYFEVYHKRIKKIEPLDSENREISPHIQRDWQYLNVLPEVDPEYQAYEEKRIAKAFVYALISGKIGYRKHDTKGHNYCYELIDAKLRSPELIVSNGTSCDQFYEVLDALTICPRYVDHLLEMYQEEKLFEGVNGAQFNDTQFRNVYTKSFVIDEFSDKPIMNIFFIPILYKASAGANYIEAWGQALVSAIFEMIDDQVNTFESEKARDDTKCDYLLEIYDEFNRNIDALVKIGSNTSNAIRKHSRLKRMYNDSITLRIYDEVAGILEAVDGKNSSIDQYADKVDEIMESRRKLSETKI